MKIENFLTIWMSYHVNELIIFSMFIVIVIDNRKHDHILKGLSAGALNFTFWPVCKFLHSWD